MTPRRTIPAKIGAVDPMNLRRHLLLLLAAAKAIGVVVPHSLLRRADEVIE